MSFPTSITSNYFSWGGCNTNGSRRKNLILIITQWMCFSFLPCGFFGVFFKKSSIFFIDVLTWHGQQRASKAFFCHCYVPFTNRECRWHYRECRPPPSSDKPLLQGRVFFKLKVLLNLPLLFLVDMLQVLGGGFSF
jgi:hypothetical protein